MILFIHPRTDTLLKEMLPMSLPALIDRLDTPVAGRFHDEWTAEEVEGADIVLMDIHWHLSLKSALSLSRRLKRIKPGVVIITGGLTASLFPHQILRNSAVDYIVRGDAEVPLKLLVDAVIGKAPVEGIPNVVSRDHFSDLTYALSAADMEKSNYLDISFFPTFERRIWIYHRNYSVPVTFPTYPYLMVFRGCPMNCSRCYGSPDVQRRLFNRDFVLRPAERVKEDLLALADDGRIRFVNVFHDFVTTLGLGYAETVLSSRYDLFLSYELFRLPTKEQLELLLGSFAGGKILFCLDDEHGSSRGISDVGRLIDRIKQARAFKNYRIILSYVERFLPDATYREALERVKGETGVALNKTDFWWDHYPVPDERGLGGEEDYRNCLAWTNKYFFMNRAFRTGAAVYRHAPLFARKTASWFFS